MLPVTPFYPLDRKVKVISPKKDPRLKGKAAGTYLIIKFFRKKLIEISPDSILNFMFPSFFLLITSGLNLNIYISIRNDPSKIAKYDLIFLRKILFKKAKGVIAQTNYAKKVLTNQTGHGNIKVIPNFVKPFRGRDTSVTINKTIICTGRLIKGKGYDHLLDIFHAVIQKYPEWRLIILGDGPERNALINQSKGLGIMDKVDFMGFQEDVDKHLQSAKIFAFCSKSEGFPNALLEAMATPLPCIAYDCLAGPSELINDGQNGFLVPLNDKKYFADKLLTLMESERLQEQFKYNSVKVRDIFSVQLLGEKYLSTILSK